MQEDILRFHFSDDSDTPTVQSLEHGPILDQRPLIKKSVCLADGIPEPPHLEAAGNQGAQSNASAPAPLPK